MYGEAARLLGLPPYVLRYWETEFPELRPRKTGIGRNPRTGAEVNIPPGKAVRFKPGKELQSIE